MFSNHAAAERHCAKIDIKRTMRSVFARRILRFIRKFGRNSSGYLSARDTLDEESILQASSSGSLWDYARNSPSDEDGAEETTNKSQVGGDTEVPDSGGDGGNPPEGAGGDDDEGTDECAIIYVRVSSNEQKEDGRSLDSQVEELTSIVESDPNMRAFTPEPIRDEGETGTNFDRDGIQRVAELAHDDEVTHLFVDTIDRIGRSVAETIMFIKHLRRKCGVKLKTRTQEFDIRKPTDKMQVTMLAAMADFGTMNRARSAHRSKADNFLKEKNWSSWYGKYVPFGYEQINGDSDEAGWIEPVNELKVVVQDIYEEFINCGNYSTVAEEINKKYRSVLNEYCVDSDELVDEVLSRQQIKAILRRPVYKGEPTLPVTSLNHYEEHPSVNDPELAMVSAETFEKAQDIVTQLKEKYSSKDELSFSPADYAEEFSPFVVDTVSPIVQLLCPKCENELVSDGQYQIDTRYASRMYKCSNKKCDYHRRWPKESEQDMMKMLVKLDEFQSIL